MYTDVIVLVNLWYHKKRHLCVSQHVAVDLTSLVSNIEIEFTEIHLIVFSMKDLADIFEQGFHIHSALHVHNRK